MALKVVDEVIERHGGTGISRDFPLVSKWPHLRTPRPADGPDAIPRRQASRLELRSDTEQ